MNPLKPQAPFQVAVMPEEARLGREMIENVVRVVPPAMDRPLPFEGPSDSGEAEGPPRHTCRIVLED